MGFVPDVFVVITSDSNSDLYKFESVGEQCVLVSAKGCGKIPVKVTVSAAELADRWSIKQASQEIIVHTGDMISPHAHADNTLECAKAIARIALETAFCQHNLDAFNGGGGGFEVHLKSKKSVVVKSAYAKGKLMLVPFSTSISALSKDGGAGSVCLGCPNDPNGKIRIFVSQRCDYANDAEKASGCHSKEVVPFVVPFWCVKPEADSASANMSVSHVRIKVATASALTDDAGVVVDIPVLTNSCNLKSGDQLKVFDQERAACNKIPTKKRGNSAPGGTTKKSR
ncbi:unnamed protein product [Prorocentrum cordatum]|uniref:Uncharacterized protein n=1 Tax=Prorocentrum cordatum TaxID=2364126 RepID=A0ABN9PV14_9DINO|nr:unnamed protein product [Polarella glacialis]